MTISLSQRRKLEALGEGKFNLTITQSTEAETKKITYKDVPITEEQPEPG